jgi:UDP-N-acetylmuramyl tripeptide synthase
MHLIQTDSRRLTGPNLLSDRAGAVLDVIVPEQHAEPAIAAWQAAVRQLLDAVGWQREQLHVHRFPGGASLAITAPIDTLNAATEVNEDALAAANAALAGLPPPDRDGTAARLRQLIAAEQQPRVLALSQAAAERRVTFLVDDALVSVGTGTGAHWWPLAPAVETVPWSRVHDVPVALVTGANGKTTTVRLVAGLLEAAGRVPGYCCSDSVTVGHETLERGDWSGPGGARLLLRDRRVEAAVLEAARGGILRRGLAVSRADAAIITNIAEDHFGEFGVFDLHSLARSKLVVRRALGPSRPLVLNADDPTLVELAPQGEVPIVWFTLEPPSPLVRAHLEAGGDAALLDAGQLVLARGARRIALAAVDELPIALGGVARHNIANALGAAALASYLGVPPAQIAQGLRDFGGGPGENPGRLNLFSLGGVTAVADFAHNPHGMAALVASAAALPAVRRLVILGQAGDRDDRALRDLARSAWAFHPDRIVLKEMDNYLRGRAPGEITGIMREEFLRAGTRPEIITTAPSEYDAVIEALTWARPGDLLLLPVHSERTRVLALLERLRQVGWQPGTSLPA